MQRKMTFQNHGFTVSKYNLYKKTNTGIFYLQALFCRLISYMTKYEG